MAVGDTTNVWKYTGATRALFALPDDYRFRIDRTSFDASERVISVWNWPAGEERVLQASEITDDGDYLWLKPADVEHWTPATMVYDYRITVYRRTPMLQSWSPATPSSVDPATLAGKFDALVRIVQQLGERVANMLGVHPQEAGAFDPATVPNRRLTLPFLASRRGRVLGFADTEEAELTTVPLLQTSLRVSPASIGLAADGDGIIDDYTGTTVTAEVLRGLTDETLAWGIQFQASAGIMLQPVSHSQVRIISIDAGVMAGYVDVIASTTGNEQLMHRLSVNVTRQGLTGAAAPALRIWGPQVFAFAKDDTAPTPATPKTLSAVVSHLAVTAAVWSYWDGAAWATINDPTHVSGVNTLALTVAYDSTLWGTAKILRLSCAATDGTTVVSDEITLYKVYDGVDGYMAVLTNEAHAISCNSAGTPAAGEIGSGGRAYTDIICRKGARLLTLVTTDPVAGQAKIVSADGVGCTATIVDVNTVRVDTISADVGRVDITLAMESGATTLVKSMTWNRVLAGPTGAPGATGTSGVRPSDTGLAGLWTLDDLPVVPNAGAVFLRNKSFSASDIGSALNFFVGGVTTNSCLAVSGGVLAITLAAAHGGDNTMLRVMSVATLNKLVVLRIMPPAAVSIWVESDGNSFGASLAGGQWNDVVVKTDGTGSGTFLDLDGWAAGVTYIQAIYIGDGSYTAGTVAQDASGSGRMLTPQTGLLRSQGVAGQGIDTSFGALYGSDAGLPTGSAPRSMFAWLRTTVTPSAATGVFGYGNGAPNQLFDFYYDGAGGYHQACYGNDSAAVAESKIKDGAWHHLGVTYDGTTRTLYLDGVVVAVDTPTPLATALNGNSLFFGGGNWKGQLDEPRIYSRCLSAAEVLWLYANPGSLPAQAVSGLIATTAPRKLGVSATDPTIANVGDYYYNSSSHTCRRLELSGWADTTDSAVFAACAPDILAVEGAALGGNAQAVSYVQSLAAKTAFVNALFAMYLKIQTGGSLRGGNRYDENGNTVDPTASGFFLGATGSCKVAGLTFEGAQGGGVQWGFPQLVGSPYVYPGTGNPAIVSLGISDVALIEDSSNRALSFYRFNGSTWSLVGSSLTITGTGRIQLAALSSTDVALYRQDTFTLSTYHWNGSSWSLVGSSLSLVSSPQLVSMVAMSATSIALTYHNATNGRLRFYTWSGSAWTAVGGTGLGLGALLEPQVTFLGADTVALICIGTSQLRTFKWNGTAWAQVGTSLDIDTAFSMRIVTLNATDVVVLSANGNSATIYRWNGATWAKASGSAPLSGWYSPVACALTGTDIVVADSVDHSLRIYRFAFALSLPPAREITG